MSASDPGQDLNQLIHALNRGTDAASGGEEPDGALLQPADSPGLDPLLAQAADRGASDILLVAGAPPAWRLNGHLVPTRGPALEAEEVRRLLVPLLSSREHQDLLQKKTLDFSFFRPSAGRLRANLHFQRGTLAACIRLLPTRIPTLDSLHLPASLRRLAQARQGLILVTGATGSGKSSTQAALIDLINTERHDHVVTIEDPVEYVHVNRNCIIEQIEVGRDTPDFATSVRSIVRQSPDVILVGEMRDPETIATVLTAAETGHLVLSTLHTNDTSQAVSRILDSFPSTNQAQVRQQLSLAMLAIVAQQLVPGKDGRGRYPAVEVLAGSNAVRNMIRKGDDHQLYSALSTGRAEGMITMEQSLAELVHSGAIDRETARSHCFRPEELVRYL
jgi:twitching motility protein PilT